MSMEEKKQKLPTKKEDREKLRNKGQFWTPQWVAKAMMAYVTKDTKTVFDPGTGRGAFFEVLKEIDSDHNIHFYGIDIDNDVLTDTVYQDNRCRVELRDFIKNPPKNKFNAIIANPPYIRHHRLDKETKNFLRNLSEKITGHKIDGRAGYHVYFFIQALNLLNDNGRLAFIMPADICEGTFAKALWSWVSKDYAIEGVVIFANNATPFPNIDTNAIIFLIRKNRPKDSFFWVKVMQENSDELYNFISSDFKFGDYPSLTISIRKLKEGLATGFSRPEQLNNDYKYHLSDFARIMRGIATGANEFFFLTKRQVKELEIPSKYFNVAIGRTKDIKGDVINLEDVRKLEEIPRPTLLLSIKETDLNLPPQLINYIEQGIKKGLPNRPLIKQRKPWYKMEKREVPPILFAYLGRRNSRFIRNEAGVIPLTGFLCVYPHKNDEKNVRKLLEILNHPETLNNLKLVGKSYGSGAIKVEPRSLERLPIPEHLIKQNLSTNNQIKLNRFIPGDTSNLN